MELLVLLFAVSFFLAFFEVGEAVAVFETVEVGEEKDAVDFFFLAFFEVGEAGAAGAAWIGEAGGVDSEVEATEEVGASVEAFEVGEAGVFSGSGEAVVDGASVEAFEVGEAGGICSGVEVIEDGEESPSDGAVVESVEVVCEVVTAAVM